MKKLKLALRSLFAAAHFHRFFSASPQYGYDYSGASGYDYSELAEPATTPPPSPAPGTPVDEFEVDFEVAVEDADPDATPETAKTALLEKLNEKEPEEWAEAFEEQGIEDVAKPEPDAIEVADQGEDLVKGEVAPPPPPPPPDPANLDGSLRYSS